MEANVRFCAMDWKDSVDPKWLHKAVKEIEGLGRGSSVEEHHSAVCDSKIVLVLPGDAGYRSIPNDLADILAYCEEMSINGGEFHFRFSAESGMPATPWLNYDQALDWVNGIACSDELSCDTLGEVEKAEYTEIKRKCLEMLAGLSD